MGDIVKCEEEPQSRPFFKSVRNYFREYCNCTSIHGFRYFGEKRTIFERVWWFLIFSITLATCIFCIREVYQKWLRSPVIVSFATKETPTYSIPFPAVTICPESKSVQALYSHTGMLRKVIDGVNITDDERNVLDYMGLICDKNRNMEYSNKYTFTEEVYEHFQKVNFGNDPFQSCEYMGDIFDCSRLFKPIITDEGICYTFNMLDRSEIFRNDM
ncbi:unnamed protein product [Phaedon cochleariae]|uniref:Uncharacterized protein n=1 Tax=Phaedon cochleariae TaxID=80249 RepID=A0A9P0GHD8_PHACE|nr:unnamed protein product [Phaedon cochleariae]